MTTWTNTASGIRFGHRVVVVLLAGACLLFGVVGASTAKTKTVTHCISPSGLDLNEFFGVSARIVAPPFCTQVGAGEHWTVATRWSVNHTFESVPAGFVPAAETPLEDFIAKFAAVRYVVDPGTRRQTTHVFRNDGELFVGTLSGFPVISPITLGALHPLSRGPHVVTQYWVLRAMHCDGFGDVVADNCIPAGKSLAVTGSFTVTPHQR
jgi:hypothetical protein